MQAPIREEAARAGLTIGAARAWPLEHPVDRAKLQAHLWEEGYFVAPPSIPAVLVERCCAAIELVRARGAPPLAAFACDAPWELSELLADHASAALDGDARLVPAFWAWRLDQHSEARGWAPHRDHPERDVDDRGAPDSLTLWVALTDATPDNGCVYVVPAPLDPHYRDPAAPPAAPHLQSIRAVPAPAGSVLGWTSKLLHWSGLADAHAPPRISLSFAFQAANRPLFDGASYPLGWIPSLAERRTLISQQWHRHAHRHASAPAREAALLRVTDDLLTPTGA